jgi:hypothetical protein
VVGPTVGSPTDVAFGGSGGGWAAGPGGGADGQHRGSAGVGRRPDSAW